MANNNVQNVRFLRNGSLFTSREQATSALTNFTLTSEMDGSSILARYQEGTDPIKTLVGFVYYKDASNKSVTIFDIDDAGADVDEKIKEIKDILGSGVTSSSTVTAQLEALSGTSSDGSGVTSVAGAKAYAKDYTDEQINGLDYSGVTTGAGVYVTNVTETDGKISATTATLPDASSVADDNKVITDVTQSKGAITATPKLLTDVKLSGYAEADSVADIATSDTLGQALGKLQRTIHDMDLEVVSGNGEVITAVSEANGVVDAKTAAIKDVKLTGYEKTSATGAIAATDDIEDALSKLENTIGSNAITNADGSITVTPANGSTTDVKLHIKDGEKVIKLDGNGGGIYTDIKIASATPSSTTVKEEYNLLDSDGNALGASIKIYKDSHIVSITYITNSGDTHYQNLEYVYIDASGATKTEYVDISSLVLEQLVLMVSNLVEYKTQLILKLMPLMLMRVEVQLT